MVLFGLLGSGFVGFAIGLFAFKVKSRWCPEHGTPLMCPECLMTRRRSRWMSMRPH
jgi:hypothetical protein